MSERTWGFESPLAHSLLREGSVEREAYRSPVRRGRKWGRRRGGRALPPWASVCVSALLFLVVAGVILLVVRGCVATQQATGIRKYVATSDSILLESQHLGNGRLQRALEDASDGRVSSRHREDLRWSAERSRELYERTLASQKVPRRFAQVHHYLQSALGIRARATGRIARAASGSRERLRSALSSGLRDYKMSDAVISHYYMPAVREVLREEGQINEDDAIIYHPAPFVDYGASGLGGGRREGAAHGVRISGVSVGGHPLYPGGTVILKGADRPVFRIEVANDGGMVEDGVPVEISVAGGVESQVRTARIRRIEPGRTETVTLGGFKPGVVDETSRVRVEVGPVRYEQYTRDNTLSGRLTFGI
ncbi:hypothetical protein [Rubrobacter calidifluminis]|uniref:hypothetical protein n=1 Tax=Rubrobacter calidifluminis TaxID=1392640 RepID=UPI00235E72B8|nr:hypothetical protein [Rubrobacter calidifluminis]